MTIQFRDENKMEIIDSIPQGETTLLNIIIGIIVISIIYSAIKTPSQSLFAIIPLVIFGAFWYHFRKSRPTGKTITIDKISDKLTIETTYISGKKDIKDTSLNTIKSIGTLKKQLFYAFGQYRGQLPTMYFEFIQTDGNKIKIWIEKKQLNNSWSNYLNDEEKMIPEKISKFLNIPLSS